jgi:hypothetical protein
MMKESSKYEDEFKGALPSLHSFFFDLGYQLIDYTPKTLQGKNCLGLKGPGLRGKTDLFCEVLSGILLDQKNIQWVIPQLREAFSQCFEDQIGFEVIVYFPQITFKEVSSWQS